MSALDQLLFDAVNQQDIDTVRLVIDAGADVNTKGQHGLTALQSAVLTGSRALASALMEYGADPHAITADGATVLGLATAADDVAMLRTLSNFCADFESASFNGKSCLQIAVESRADNALGYLLAHGASVHAVDEEGNSLLQSACSLSHLELVDSLLEFGADPEHRNFAGHSVLQTALHAGSYPVTRVIARSVDRTHLASELASAPANVSEPDRSNWSESIPSHFRMAWLTALLRMQLAIGRIRDFVAEGKRAKQEAVRMERDLAMTALSTGDLAAALTSVRQRSLARSGEIGDGLLAFRTLTCSSDDHATVTLIVGELLGHASTVSAINEVTGETLLHAACRMGRVAAIEILLSTAEGRALVNRADRLLNRPVHLAAMGRHHDIIKLLFKAGADMNAVNRDGHSPLHLTAISTDVATAQTLLAHRGNSRLRTRHGKSVVQCLPPESNRSDFKEAIARHEVQRRRPSIFSRNHPLAALSGLASMRRPT